MRLIDADNLTDRFMAAIVPDVYKPSYSIAEIIVEIDHEPTVDAIPAVRGRDCKYAYESSPGFLYCHRPNCKRHLYCAADELHICGERKEPE